MVEGIPDRIWEGGAGTMTIDVDTTCQARINISCSQPISDDEERNIDCWERIDAGTRSWTIAASMPLR